MKSVYNNVEEEAEKKHLKGAAKKRYVGGTIGNITRRSRGGAIRKPKRTAKEEKKEASDHWKKYHRYSNTELRTRVTTKYRALSQPQRQKAIAYIRRKGWTTNFATMDRRQLEQLTDYMESIK